MSPVAGWRRHPLIERVGYHLVRARAWARRATRLGLGLRGLVWLTGFGALLLAMPPAARWSAAVPLAALLALLAAAAPAGRWVTVLAVIAIGLVAVRLGAAPPAMPLVLAGLVGALLYLHHCGAALAATLRTDTVIPGAVLRYWAARAGLVLAASAGLGLGTTALPTPTAWSATSFLALGTATATIAAAALIWLARRAAPSRTAPR